ncbi:MAG: hypothetical protein U0168_16840 [Nannocystaceae bacterium]
MHAVIEVSGSDVRVIDLGDSTGSILGWPPSRRTTCSSPATCSSSGPSASRSSSPRCRPRRRWA